MIKFVGSFHMMKHLLYISFFLCCYSGSFNILDNALDDSHQGKSKTGLPEINLSSNNTYIQYLIIDDNIYFNTQSEDDTFVIKTERRNKGHVYLTKRTFHPDHPFCFSKSTDPFLELDIPPPFYS